MDGRGERRRERRGRGRSLPQCAGTGGTVFLPQGQGGGAQGSRTCHQRIKTTEGLISFPVTGDVTAITTF